MRAGGTESTDAGLAVSLARAAHAAALMEAAAAALVDRLPAGACEGADPLATLVCVLATQSRPTAGFFTSGYVIMRLRDAIQARDVVDAGVRAVTGGRSRPWTRADQSGAPSSGQVEHAAEVLDSARRLCEDFPWRLLSPLAASEADLAGET